MFLPAMLYFPELGLTVAFQFLIAASEYFQVKLICESVFVLYLRTGLGVLVMAVFFVLLYLTTCKSNIYV